MTTNDLILVNRKELKRFETKVMSKMQTIVFKKGLIEGCNYPINMSARCIETNEVFHFIWQKVSQTDTDGCSFGELI